jgi:predicted methyltransferase
LFRALIFSLSDENVRCCAGRHHPNLAGATMSKLPRTLLFLGLLGGCASTPAPAAQESTTPPPSAAASVLAAPPPEPEAAPAEPAPVITPVDPATAPKAAPFAVSKSIEAIVAAKDRPEADRALDAGRHPGELLAFFGVKPGMKVAELFAGGGYTSELLARAVGKSGVVYGQNNHFILERFAEKPWSERLARPVMKHVVRVDRELDDPLPPEAKDLDAVFAVLIYHDTVWLGVDRDKMNQAVFAALKSGGTYAIVDHSGRVGSGTSETQSFHRIEESALRAEVERAGFKVAGEAMFLRNPADTRDWNDSPIAAAERRGTSDRFVLKFVKP